MPFMKPSAVFSRESRRRARAAAAVLATASALAVLVHGRAAGTVDKSPPLSAARESLSRDRLYPVPFGDGETLVYTIAWLKIEGGEMTLRTSRETSTDGVPVHRIALIASSNDYVSKFYPVRDLYETWVDARDFQPLRFEKHAREGRYESDEVEEFDLARKVGTWREDRTPLPDRVQDIISSFYYLRTQPLAVGRDVRVDMFSRGKIYKLKASVLEREKVETEAGTFDALKVQPQLRENETAEDRNRGKLFLWFSDDERRFPVMARTVMPIGSVTARLRKIVVGAKASASPESRTQKGDRPAAP
ncbi:MAG TPA: DUF3108 domain-containing protein [Thermoanaerobaculia bacterium]|nr:DUF3108 domain-containing protein [Thermoanaerobaculia bacterium]